AAIYLTGDSLPLRPGIQPCPLCTGGQVGVSGSGTCEGGLNNGMACTPANTDVNGGNGMGPASPTRHACPPRDPPPAPAGVAPSPASSAATAAPPTRADSSSRSRPAGPTGPSAPCAA